MSEISLNVTDLKGKQEEWLLVLRRCQGNTVLQFYLIKEMAKLGIFFFFFFFLKDKKSKFYHLNPLCLN